MRYSRPAPLISDGRPDGSGAPLVEASSSVPLIGCIDRISRECVSGWALDSVRPGLPVGLVISINGHVIARCLADQRRPDVEKAGFGTAYCGFEFIFPKPLSPLRDHELHLRREGDGVHLAGSPKTIGIATSLDSPTRLAIEQFVASLDIVGAGEALAFFALQAERLRDVLTDRLTGHKDKRHSRGLGYEHSKTVASTVAAKRARPRALVIDDHIPVPHHDGGSDAILSHMHSLQRLGYEVNFVPASMEGDPAVLEAYGIATYIRPIYASVEEVLCRQAGDFKLVYLHRLTNATRYIGLVRHHQPVARLIYSVADLHFLRTGRQAKIEDRPELAALSAHQRLLELTAGLICDGIITHSSQEAEILRAHLPPGKVHVVPWAVAPRPVAEPFDTRRGVIFLANYEHQPNADAARILFERIMPEIWKHDALFPCLFAGRLVPDWLRNLAQGSPAKVLGDVPDLNIAFERVCASVAPLAFGAGLKGKVLKSLAAGIPCVCTSIAAEGLDLPEPLAGLIADEPAALAAMILRLDRDAQFNAICATAGLDFIAVHFSENAIDSALLSAIRGERMPNTC